MTMMFRTGRAALLLLLMGSVLPLQAAELEIGAVHGLVIGMEDQTVRYEKHADVAVPIASLTKLMTALVVVESGADLEQWLEVLPASHEVDKNAFTRLRQGSEARRRDLLLLALMASENLAAQLLADHHPGGRKAFVAAMNAKAKALGMTQTWYVDSSGLSPMNRSSARDQAALVLAAYQQPLIRELSTTSFQSVSFRKPRYQLGYGNTNGLIYSQRWQVALSKTGYLSEAGRCLVMVTEVADEPMVMVFLDALGKRTPLGDAGRVRRWLESGQVSPVAAAAKQYQARKVATLEQL